MATRDARFIDRKTNWRDLGDRARMRNPDAFPPELLGTLCSVACTILLLQFARFVSRLCFAHGSSIAVSTCPYDSCGHRVDPGCTASSARSSVRDVAASSPGTTILAYLPRLPYLSRQARSHVMFRTFLLPFTILAMRALAEAYPDRTLVLGGVGSKGVEENREHRQRDGVPPPRGGRGPVPLPGRVLRVGQAAGVGFLPRTPRAT